MVLWPGMLRELPEELVRAHVAPHLADADVANCAAAFGAGNPLRAECVRRAARFRALQEELRELCARLARVLVLSPHARCEAELFALSAEGYAVHRQTRPHDMFALYDVKTPNFTAEACVFTQHVDVNVDVRHVASGGTVHFYARRTRYARVQGRKDRAMSPSLTCAAERGFGLRRSQRLCPSLV